MNTLIALVLLGATLFAAFAALHSVVTSTSHHTSDEETLSAIKMQNTLATVDTRTNWD